jgi:hypothetical protein
MRTLLRAVPLLLLAATVAAQEPAEPEAAAPPAAPRAPAAPRPDATPSPEPPPRPTQYSLTNVRVDLTLIDQSGAREPVRKTVTITLGDGERGSVRSRPQALVSMLPGAAKNVQVFPLNVDARPTLVGSRIKLLLILEYSSAEQQAGEDAAPKADINFSGQMVLENGRSMVVAEAADPVSDRRVTVEVKATVLK